MAHLGILLACEHYPIVTRQPRTLDAQLRRWIGALGHDVTEITVFSCFEGEMPPSVSAADVWIVSGRPLAWSPCCRDLTGRMIEFLRAVAALDRPVLAVHHGEHLVHSALARVDAPPLDTPGQLRSIRNPFVSFHARDRLFAFDPTTRRVCEQTRPEDITLAGYFSPFRIAG